MAGRTGPVVLILWAIGWLAIPFLALVVNDEDLGVFIVTAISFGLLAFLLARSGSRHDGHEPSSGFLRQSRVSPLSPVRLRSSRWSQRSWETSLVGVLLDRSVRPRDGRVVGLPSASSARYSLTAGPPECHCRTPGCALAVDLVVAARLFWRSSCIHGTEAAHGVLARAVRRTSRQDPHAMGSGDGAPNRRSRHGHPRPRR